MQLINNLLPNIPIPEVFRQNMLGDSIPRFRKKNGTVSKGINQAIER